MADEQQDDSSKTEDPTPRKLEESRKKGQVAVSREVNNWLMLLAATILVGTMSAPVMGGLRDHLRFYLENAAQLPGVPGGFSIVLGESFWKVMGLLAIPLLMLMAAGIVGPFLQAGPIFAPEVVKMSLEKVSPVAGFRRLFSRRAIMEFVKGLFKIGLVGFVGFFVLYPLFGTVDHLVGMPMPIFLDEMLAMFLKLMTGMLIVLMVIAMLDLAYQRTEHSKKMRMTRQELRDEYRQTEGDPQVKARLRQLRGERARQRMMQAVPEADVVITNPTHYAVALKYDPEKMDAPVVVAKGVEAVALRIREVAKEHKVIIYEAPPLARAIYDTVDLDEMIPAELYKAVAEVISFVFKMKGKMKMRPA